MSRISTGTNAEPCCTRVVKQRRLRDAAARNTRAVAAAPSYAFDWARSPSRSHLAFVNRTPVALTWYILVSA